MQSRHITNLVDEAFQSMVRLRLAEGTWKDEGNQKPGMVMTCEGLESLLIPCLSSDDVDISPLFVYLNFIKDKLVEDVRGIIKDSKVGFFSAPYSADSGSIMDGAAGEDKQTVDSASFVVSTLIHFKQVFREDLEENDGLRQELLDAIRRGISFLEQTNKKEGGWSWGEDTSAATNLYSTWSALETLVDVVRYYPDYENIHQVELAIAQTKKWLADTHMETISQGRRIEFLSDLVGTIPLNYYYNLYSIVGLLSGEGDIDSRLEKGLGTGIKAVTEAFKNGPHVFDADFRIPMESGKGGLVKQAIYTDRCFVPLLLKATVLYLIRFPGTDLSADLEKDFTILLTELEGFRFGSKEKAKPEDKKAYGGMWNKYAYSIYYTERAMEVLSKLHRFFRNKEGILPRSGTPTADDLVIPKLSLMSPFVQLLKTRDAQEHVIALIKEHAGQAPSDRAIIDRMEQLGKSLRFQKDKIDTIENSIKSIKEDLQELGSRIDIVFKNKAGEGGA